MFILYAVAGFFVLSFLLVGIGLCFKKDLGVRTFTDGYTVQNYELPDWLKWLQNPEDNLTGDKRGWYWTVYMDGKPAWFKMLWWSAWRNPFNYLKRVVIGIDIRQFSFHKLCGADEVRDDFYQTGFQILYAKPLMGGWPRPMLYWVRRWGYSNRAIVVQLGWKIKLSHAGATYSYKWDYFKGLTFEVQPAKKID